MIVLQIVVVVLVVVSEHQHECQFEIKLCVDLISMIQTLQNYWIAPIWCSFMCFACFIAFVECDNNAERVWNLSHDKIEKRFHCTTTKYDNLLQLQQSIYCWCKDHVHSIFALMIDLMINWRDEGWGWNNAIAVVMIIILIVWCWLIEYWELSQSRLNVETRHRQLMHDSMINLLMRFQTLCCNFLVVMSTTCRHSLWLECLVLLLFDAVVWINRKIRKRSFLKEIVAPFDWLQFEIFFNLFLCCSCVDFVISSHNSNVFSIYILVSIA
jgi:hypothetical protein